MATVTATDIRYLVRLADWAAGEGFCQIEGLIDPDDFIMQLWERFAGPEADYSPAALADAVAASLTPQGPKQ